MKGIILAMFMALSLSAFAGGPSTRDLAAADRELRTKIELLETAQNEIVARQAGIIDSLQAYIKEGSAIVKKPVTSSDDTKELLGFLLGFITFLVQNILLRIGAVNKWVSDKFSKTTLAITLGLAATAITFVIVSIHGTVDVLTVVKWLVGAWGTHFGVFAMQVKKVKAA